MLRPGLYCWFSSRLVLAMSYWLFPGSGPVLYWGYVFYWLTQWGHLLIVSILCQFIDCACPTLLPAGRRGGATNQE